MCSHTRFCTRTKSVKIFHLKRQTKTSCTWIRITANRRTHAHRSQINASTLTTTTHRGRYVCYFLYFFQLSASVGSRENALASSTFVQLRNSFFLRLATSSFFRPHLPQRRTTQGICVWLVTFFHYSSSSSNTVPTIL